jgi:hypothetical protein
MLLLRRAVLAVWHLLVWVTPSLTAALVALVLRLTRPQVAVVALRVTIQPTAALVVQAAL